MFDVSLLNFTKVKMLIQPRTIS